MTKFLFKSMAIAVVAFAMLFAQIVTAIGQPAPQYTLRNATFSNGGSVHSNGRYQLTTSIGQPADSLSGGEYTMQLGVLSGGSNSTQIYLPIINR